MKKILFTMVIMLAAVINTNAMPYQQAREQALFLTDKMAYELNLNDQQYEAAYEINLDYLMDVTTVDDVYSASWRQRNIDLQYILLDWQYNAFCAASYFFRPLYWNAGNWHFAVYAHYPHHDFFYFSRPACYVSYRGAHSWRYNGGRSWYMHRVNDFRRPGFTHTGLRDSYRPTPGRRPEMGNGRPSYRNTNQRPGNNGNSRPTYNGNRNNGRPNNGYGNNNGNRYDRNDNGRPDRGNSHNYNRESSTRRTVTNGNSTPAGSSRPNTNTTRPNTNSGYRPTPGSGSPSFNGATRSGGSTFRGNSGSRPSTNSAGVGRR